MIHFCFQNLFVVSNFNDSCSPSTRLQQGQSRSLWSTWTKKIFFWLLGRNLLERWCVENDMIVTIFISITLPFYLNSRPRTFQPPGRQDALQAPSELQRRRWAASRGYPGEVERSHHCTVGFSFVQIVQIESNQFDIFTLSFSYRFLLSKKKFNVIFLDLNFFNQINTLIIWPGLAGHSCLVLFTAKKYSSTLGSASKASLVGAKTVKGLCPAKRVVSVEKATPRALTLF